MEENIREAKKALQELIIPNVYVTSISTRFRGADSYIEVGVAEEKYISKIKSHLDNGKWQGHPVEVIVEPPSKPL